MIEYAQGHITDNLGEEVDYSQMVWGNVYN